MGTFRAKEPLLELLRFNSNHGHPDGLLKYAKILVVEEIIDQNYDPFKNKFHKRPNGLAIGSPISPILAQIFMNDFEEQSVWEQD